MVCGLNLGPVVEFDSPPLRNLNFNINDYEKGNLTHGGIGSGNRCNLFCWSF